jgi:putative membrane protein
MDKNEPILDETNLADPSNNNALANPLALFFIFLKGMGMGAADVVPGVSGGTVAFITGIYERLLNAIKSADITAIKLLFSDGIGAVWKRIDGTFLVALFAGIFTSLFSLAKVLKWCMAEYPQLLWAFFFGLIIASTIYIIKQVSKWNAQAIVGLIVGAIVAYTITVLAPSEASTAPWMIFLAGSIAICAMILPGISGSFILLLMGMYGHVLHAANSKDFGFLIIFMLGCIVGLLLFSHVLSWTFRNHKNTTLAVLSGFMVGSLKKVWPWQNVLKTRTNSHGEEVPWIWENVMPSNYSSDSMLLWCGILLILGFSVVFLLELVGDNTPKEEA